MASLSNLHRILHKAEHLDEAIKRGDLDRQNQILLSHALSNDGEQDVKQRKRMVDEIKAKRERDRDKMVLDKERRIRSLNEDRWKLMQREQEVYKEGALHARLVEKGVDFLANLETGLANRDDVVKDFGYVEPKERDEPLEEVIQAARSELPRLEDRIRALKVKKETTDRVISYMTRPYEDYEMRRWRQTVPTSTFVAMKDLVYDIVEEVWDKIVGRQQEIATILQHKDYYEQKNSLAIKKLQQQSNNKALIQ
jgi:hypothetical protein